VADRSRSVADQGVTSEGVTRAVSVERTVLLTEHRQVWFSVTLERPNMPTRRDAAISGIL